MRIGIDDKCFDVHDPRIHDTTYYLMTCDKSSLYMKFEVEYIDDIDPTDIDSPNVHRIHNHCNRVIGCSSAYVLLDLNLYTAWNFASRMTYKDFLGYIPNELPVELHRCPHEVVEYLATYDNFIEVVTDCKLMDAYKEYMRITGQGFLKHDNMKFLCYFHDHVGRTKSDTPYFGSVYSLMFERWKAAMTIQRAYMRYRSFV